MTRFDFSPLYRSSVGFDRITRLMEAALNAEDAQQSYPPYNIEKTGEYEYRITMAVAGFDAEDLDITTRENTLIVSGKIKDGEDKGSYLHRGIARRAFQRRFNLADFIEVVGAKIENGLLHIDLKRELPEAMKPRRIEIQTESSKRKTIQGKKAA